MTNDLSVGRGPAFFQNLANLEKNPKLKLTLKVMGVVVGVLATMAIVAGIGGALSLGGVHIFAVIHSPYNIAMVSAGGAGLITVSVMIVVGFTIKYLNREKAKPREHIPPTDIDANTQTPIGSYDPVKREAQTVSLEEAVGINEDEEEVASYPTEVTNLPIGERSATQLDLQLVPSKEVSNYCVFHRTIIKQLLKEQKVAFVCLPTSTHATYFGGIGLRGETAEFTAKKNSMHYMKQFQETYTSSNVITDFNAFKQIVETMEKEGNNSNLVLAENEALAKSIIELPTEDEGWIH